MFYIKHNIPTIPSDLKEHHFYITKIDTGNQELSFSIYVERNLGLWNTKKSCWWKISENLLGIPGSLQLNIVRYTYSSRPILLVSRTAPFFACKKSRPRFLELPGAFCNLPRRRRGNVNWNNQHRVPGARWTFLANGWRSCAIYYAFREQRWLRNCTVEIELPGEPWPSFELRSPFWTASSFDFRLLIQNELKVRIFSTPNIDMKIFIPDVIYFKCLRIFYYLSYDCFARSWYYTSNVSVSDSECAIRPL